MVYTNKCQRRKGQWLMLGQRHRQLSNIKSTLVLWGNHSGHYLIIVSWLVNLLTAR